MKTTLFLLLTLLLCGAAHAQTSGILEMIWESDPGVRPAGVVINHEEMYWDASGDGKQDLVLTREDDDGLLRSILVRDGATFETLWRIEDAPVTLNMNIYVGNLPFWGFADANGDGKREAIFVTETEVRAYDLSTNDLVYMVELEQTSTSRLLGLTDVDADDADEIIIFLPELRKVQVWSWSD